MRILIFNWRDVKHSWAGGSEIYIHELAKRWVEKGNRVILFCGQDNDKRLTNKELIDGIEIIRKGGRFTVYFWAPIYYFLYLRNQADIILDVENGIPFFTPLFSLKKKIALVYHVHDKQFFYELKFPLSVIGYVIEKYIFPVLYSGTRIMSISESTRQKLIKLGLPAMQIQVVTPGIISQKKFSNKKIPRYKTPTIIYLGRIKRYKRLDLLVTLFPKIIERVPGARLLIAGWGTEAPQIQDYIMRNGYKKNIQIVGPVSELEKRLLLQKSWAMINPSIHEGWGISVIEANVYSTPAIAFKVPGLSDSIKDNKTGFLALDEEDLIDKIEIILKNKRLREKMGKEAQRWAMSLTWDKSAEKSYKLLKSL